jgi:hypothetical protein
MESLLMNRREEDQRLPPINALEEMDDHLPEAAESYGIIDFLVPAVIYFSTLSIFMFLEIIGEFEVFCLKSLPNICLLESTVIALASLLLSLYTKGLHNKLLLSITSSIMLVLTYLHSYLRGMYFFSFGSFLFLNARTLLLLLVLLKTLDLRNCRNVARLFEMDARFFRISLVAELCSTLGVLSLDVKLFVYLPLVNLLKATMCMLLYVTPKLSGWRAPLLAKLKQFISLAAFSILTEHTARLLIYLLRALNFPEHASHAEPLPFFSLVLYLAGNLCLLSILINRVKGVALSTTPLWAGSLMCIVSGTILCLSSAILPCLSYPAEHSS